MEDSHLREIARKRVEFREHLYIYIIVNAFLIAINLYFSPVFLWSLFVVLFWGIGLVSHYREAYHGTREQAVEKEFKRLKLKQVKVK
jgi:uncharacterized membrane protein YdbT with pleckstrin-like domain